MRSQEPPELRMAGDKGRAVRMRAQRSGEVMRERKVVVRGKINSR
jgi:hypothetical protein